jgi:hypothetical protein
MKKKIQRMKLSRETLGALNDYRLRAVAGGITVNCDGTTDCTDTCGVATCPILSCNGANTCRC